MDKLLVQEGEFGFNSEKVNKDVACKKKYSPQKNEELIV